MRSPSSSANPFVPNSSSSWLLCEKQPVMPEEFYRLSCVLIRTLQQPSSRMCPPGSCITSASSGSSSTPFFKFKKRAAWDPKALRPRFCITTTMQLSWYRRLLFPIPCNTSHPLLFHQVMCLNWIESNQTLQWLGLAFNTFVHVIMYEAQTFVLAALCPLFDTLTPDLKVRVLRVHRVQPCAPAAQDAHHAGAAPFPADAFPRICICCLLPFLRYK